MKSLFLPLPLGRAFQKPPPVNEGQHIRHHCSAILNPNVLLNIHSKFHFQKPDGTCNVLHCLPIIYWEMPCHLPWRIFTTEHILRKLWEAISMKYSWLSFSYDWSTIRTWYQFLFMRIKLEKSRQRAWESCPLVKGLLETPQQFPDLEHLITERTYRMTYFQDSVACSQ